MSSGATSQPPRQHGVKGVYYGGDWLDIENCDAFNVSVDKCSGCDFAEACPRSRSRNVAAKEDGSYDVLIVGAGCVGASIARELSRYSLSVLLIETADDVSQGATKGNSGIVHAGYDDEPGSNRAKYCWKGNQMFAGLDKELRFGYQKNGSLVVAFTEKERKHLGDLKKRGEKNGVQRLKIIDQKELREMEPAIHPDAIAALYSPDAGNVIPYEFTVALAENAVDNGVELRIRRQVAEIRQLDEGFQVTANHWEPEDYVNAAGIVGKADLLTAVLKLIGGAVALHYASCRLGIVSPPPIQNGHFYCLLIIWVILRIEKVIIPPLLREVKKSTPLKDIVEKAGSPEGGRGDSMGSTGVIGFIRMLGKTIGLPTGKMPRKKVDVDDMLVGGSGAGTVMGGKVFTKETINCRFIVNCAGGASDQVAGMIGDASFSIKPRLGDYILLNRNQGHLARHTIFPCPDPVLGKGVLVQTTLWGNLILGPTARDMHKPEARDMSDAAVQGYILSKCKALVPSFDPTEAFHAFCGARAKSDRGDWVIEYSKKNRNMIHVAGIDSPGLAGSPAIAVDVVRMLRKAGLPLKPNPNFNPNRAPIITPKDGMKGLKMGPIGKYDSDGSNTTEMSQNIICKCEKVTELEVVRSLRRSLPIDSSQGIRKRTRAGMGHCQGDPENFNCECRVVAIISRETGVPVNQVGRRPWPATSTLSQRWIDGKEKEDLKARMENSDSSG